MIDIYACRMKSLDFEQQKLVWEVALQMGAVDLVLHELAGIFFSFTPVYSRRTDTCRTANRITAGDTTAELTRATDAGRTGSAPAFA